jgi:putative ABC transport system substrate-binding protein
MPDIRRREFITLLGGAAAWPIATRAQQTRRVVVLINHARDEPDERKRLAAFQQTLEKLGWQEGRNIRTDYRYAPGATADQAGGLVRELVAIQPDVILSQGAELTAALQRATRILPIVFVGVSDPIGNGFITSLARPGGNMTGMLLFEATIVGKWLAMLKEIAPRLTRAMLMANPKTSPYDYFMHGVHAAASSLGVELLESQVETAADIERDIEMLAREPNGGLLFPSDATINVHQDLIVSLAARRRLPAVYSRRSFVEDGGLMSYGIIDADQFQQAAIYVDRILKGEKPADLPVQAPTKYETVLNLKTAKALGIDVPPTLLVRADEVIE